MQDAFKTQFELFAKKAITSFVLAFLLLFCLFACGNLRKEKAKKESNEMIEVVKRRDKLDAVEVPQPVITKFMQRHPKAGEIRWSRTTGNGQPVYLVKFTEKDIGMGEYCTSNGEPIDEDRIELVNAEPDSAQE